MAHSAKQPDIVDHEVLHIGILRHGMLAPIDAMLQDVQAQAHELIEQNSRSVLARKVSRWSAMT